jgi:histidine triad (HIT) family protein
MTNEECIFCSITGGKIPAKKVYEDENILAFLDINPRNPGHTLVVPKKHMETLMDMDESAAGSFFETVRKVAGMVMAGTKAQGLSIAQSNGQAAGQIIPHLHFHVIPRFATEGPPGLETILPNKRMDEKTLDAIAESIKGARGAAPAPSEDEFTLEPEAEEAPAEATEKPAEEKKEEKEEEITFDF